MVKQTANVKIGASQFNVFNSLILYWNFTDPFKFLLKCCSVLWILWTTSAVNEVRRCVYVCVQQCCVKVCICWTRQQSHCLYQCYCKWVSNSILILVWIIVYINWMQRQQATFTQCYYKSSRDWEHIMKSDKLCALLETAFSALFLKSTKHSLGSE